VIRNTFREEDIEDIEVEFIEEPPQIEHTKMLDLSHNYTEHQSKLIQ